MRKKMSREHKQRLSKLMKAKDKNEITEALNHIYNHSFTFQMLWQYRKVFNNLKIEEIISEPILHVTYTYIKLLEGNIDETLEVIELFEDNSIYKEFFLLIFSANEEEFIKHVKNIGDAGYDNLPIVLLSAGKPSVLSGTLDFSFCTKKILEDPYYYDDIFKILFKDMSIKVSDVLMIEALYQRNSCYDALIKIVGLTQTLKDKEDVRLLFAVLTYQVFIMVLNNQISSTASIIESLRLKFADAGLEEFLPNIDALHAWGDMYDGNYKGIAKWLRDQAPDEYSEFCTLDIFKYFIKMRAYLIYDKHLSVTYLASKINTIVDRTYRYRDMCELQVIWAMSEHARGDLNSAFIHLTMALDIAREYRFDRVIADEGVRIYELLKEYRKQKGNDKYVDKVIELSRKTALSFPKYLKSQLPEQPSLTTTEMSVLKLIAAGHTNAEIARITETSIDNAKFHCKNIFSKLNVSNRHQAVKRAVEIGLLELTDI